MAHKTAAQITAMTIPATANRFGAESRSRDGATEGEGCVAPPWWW
jgi:hypothetical protein